MSRAVQIVLASLAIYWVIGMILLACSDGIRDIRDIAISTPKGPSGHFASMVRSTH